MGMLLYKTTRMLLPFVLVVFAPLMTLQEFGNLFESQGPTAPETISVD
jgi:hypothetical protein